MKCYMFEKILRACTIVAAFLVIGVAQSAAYAQEGPSYVAGGGEVTAAPAVEYVGHDGKIRRVPSIDVIGNRITFAFFAKRKAEGVIDGEMQVVDHTLRQVFRSDVAQLDQHPVHHRPVGSTSSGSPSARMFSSKGGVTVDGEPRPGWSFRNEPVFDSDNPAIGVGDTVCFELVNPEGVVVLQWSGFLSSGNIRSQD